MDTIKLLGSFILVCFVVSAKAKTWECAQACAQVFNNKADVAVCGCLEADSDVCRWFHSQCVMETCASEYGLKPNSHCDLSKKPKTTINDDIPVPPNNDNGRN